jgi:hypothetical protein
MYSDVASLYVSVYNINKNSFLKGDVSIMEQRITVGERFRKGFVTLGALESQFSYMLDCEVCSIVNRGKEMFVEARIEKLDVRFEERRGNLYVEVVLVRDFMDLPEEQKRYRHKEHFVFTKNVDILSGDGLDDIAEDIGKAVAQIMLMDTLSYVSAKRLEGDGWILEIEQPVIYHAWKRCGVDAK